MIEDNIENRKLGPFLYVFSVSFQHVPVRPCLHTTTKLRETPQMKLKTNSWKLAEKHINLTVRQILIYLEAESHDHC